MCKQAKQRQNRKFPQMSIRFSVHSQNNVNFLCLVRIVLSFTHTNYVHTEKSFVKIHVEENSRPDATVFN